MPRSVAVSRRLTAEPAETVRAPRTAGADGWAAVALAAPVTAPAATSKTSPIRIGRYSSGISLRRKEKRARGRPAQLSREAIVEAALALIDDQGLDALTMRRLGAELGVEAMALYTHVRNKDDLLTAVGERIVGEFTPAPVEPDDWRGRIRASVMAWADLQIRHPQAFPLVYRFRPDTREGVAIVEAMLEAFGIAGLDSAGAALAYCTLIGCLDGMLLAGYLTTYAGGLAWSRAAPLVDADRFPRYRSAAAHAAGLSGAEIFEHALELLLRGIEQDARRQR
jgi:AcrR family transcriptional regulator